MRHKSTSLAALTALLAGGLLSASDTRAETPVALEPVLAVDTFESVDGYEDFEQAFRRKLLRELTPVVSRNEAPPQRQVEKSPADSGRFGSRAAE